LEKNPEKMHLLFFSYCEIFLPLQAAGTIKIFMTTKDYSTFEIASSLPTNPPSFCRINTVVLRSNG
jgi:hypothetical protein